LVKSILIPTDGSKSASIGVDYAIEWAKHHKAKLHGLHVVDVKLLEGPFLRDISASLGTAPYANYEGNMSMVLEERGKAALADFEKRCADADVSYATELATGVVPQTIIEQSNLVDLIVMGRGGEHNQWLDGLLGSTSESVIRRGKQPVIVTGHVTPAQSPFLAAYDGSEHAKHALKTAAEVAKNWHVALHVLAVNGGNSKGCLDEAREYLDQHEVESEYVERSGNAGEAIVEYANETKCGLLVMGAFGHSKVLELVIGSTTAFAMNHAKCPVLLTR